MIYTEKKYALINKWFGIKKTHKQACYPEILSKIDKGIKLLQYLSELWAPNGIQ